MGSWQRLESERSRVWRHQRFTLRVVAVTALVLVTGFVGSRLLPVFALETKRRIDTRDSSVAVPTRLSANRPVYPYSIIRGGAYSKAELVDSLDTDPVAARHYANFHRSWVYVTRSSFMQPVYLSYRVGNAVYWTSRPVPLPKGEPLLSDGTNYARARCGNRISQVPQTPVNDTEPPPETLDTPQRPVNTIADLSTWTENRLLTFETPAVELSPGHPVPLSAVPTLVTPFETTPTWWTPGASGGFLAVPLTGEIPRILLPPATVPVIQPNPIPDLLPPSIPLIPPPPPPGTVLAIIPPPYVFPPDTWPPTPTIPIIPGLNPTPITQVPEPGLLPAILLACAGLAVARQRSKR